MSGLIAKINYEKPKSSGASPLRPRFHILVLYEYLHMLMSHDHIGAKEQIEDSTTSIICLFVAVPVWIEPYPMAVPIIN